MLAAPPAPKKARKSETKIELVDISDDETDSPFTLYFVSLPDVNVTEKKHLDEVFKVAKKAGLQPERIDSEDLTRLTHSDDSFVIPCFRGKLSMNLKKNIKIYGPPIVFECIHEGKQLPRPGHPVFSSVFEGARISFTSVEPERKRSLQEKLQWMGGHISECLSAETTHLVVGKAQRTEKYKTAIKNGIPLIRTDWIDDLWETSQTTMGKFSGLGKDAINSYKLNVFEGLEMAVTSIDGCDRSSLIQLIEENGGKIPGSMNRARCSHLVTDKTCGEKYLKATEWTEIRIVQTRWIRKCIQLGFLIDEEKHHPKYLTIDRAPSTSSIASNPRRDSSDGFLSPEFISNGPRRLSGSTFNLSSSILTFDQGLNSLIAASRGVASTSGVGGPRRSGGGPMLPGGRKSDQFNSTPPIPRSTTASLVRVPTSQSVSSQDVSGEVYDPIDDIRKRIDEEHGELFENCLFHVYGVEDKSRLESWRRFLNETGATRAPNIQSATHIVVVGPPRNQQEKAMMRKLTQNDEEVTIVTVQWVEECVKRREIIDEEELEWKENVVEESQ
ncbi:unnamed protein product [Caenorhabditis brenneri]